MFPSRKSRYLYYNQYAYSGRKYKERLDSDISTKCFLCSRPANQDTYTIIKIPILQSSYLYYIQDTYSDRVYKNRVDWYQHRTVFRFLARGTTLDGSSRAFLVFRFYTPVVLPFVRYYLALYPAHPLGKIAIQIKSLSFGTKVWIQHLFGPNYSEIGHSVLA